MLLICDYFEHITFYSRRNALAMQPIEIRIAMLRKGYSNRRIADACRVSCSTVSNIIYGRGTSEKIARTISEVVGVPVGTLWPDRYPRLELRQLRNAA